MKFKPVKEIEALGLRGWGCVIRGRYSFCIVFDPKFPEEGYSATWRDAHGLPQQANEIVKGVHSFSEAERACRQKEKALRPN